METDTRPKTTGYRSIAPKEVYVAAFHSSFPSIEQLDIGQVTIPWQMCNDFDKTFLEENVFRPTKFLLRGLKLLRFHRSPQLLTHSHPPESESLSFRR
jgi:hypothetical protein